jgi:hypothetical protein
MSSIIRWRRGETLRAVRRGVFGDMVSLMGSNVSEKTSPCHSVANADRHAVRRSWQPHSRVAG